MLAEDEPAWAALLSVLDRFLGVPVQQSTTDGGPSEPPRSLNESEVAVARLTDREREVLGLVAQGLSNEAIGVRLHLSERTVERHLANAYTRLGLSGRGARAAGAALITRR